MNILQGLIWKIYLKAFELDCKDLLNRFEQGNLKKYENLQQVLILTARGKNSDEKLDQVLEFYSGDFDNWKLQKLSWQVRHEQKFLMTLLVNVQGLNILLEKFE